MASLINEFCTFTSKTHHSPLICCTVPTCLLFILQRESSSFWLVFLFLLCWLSQVHSLSNSFLPPSLLPFTLQSVALISLTRLLTNRRRPPGINYRPQPSSSSSFFFPTPPASSLGIHSLLHIISHWLLVYRSVWGHVITIGRVIGSINSLSW